VRCGTFICAAFKIDAELPIISLEEKSDGRSSAVPEEFFGIRNRRKWLEEF
jgi:hypothetical protein